MASRNFVLLHGAFHGGWCWARVAGRLRAQGHHVTTPTQTGLGERRHLMSRDITVETFVLDLVNHIEAEDLRDIVLVGHSFGGIGISGAADRIPARIRHLVYFDARILEDGQCQFDSAPPEVCAERRRQAEACSGGVWVPPPPPALFGVPDGAEADWIAPRLTPHPFNTFVTPLRLANPVGNGLPRTYVTATDPGYPALQASRDWLRGRAGWARREVPGGHDAMVTAPDATARLLAELAA